MSDDKFVSQEFEITPEMEEELSNNKGDDE